MLHEASSVILRHRTLVISSEPARTLSRTELRSQKLHVLSSKLFSCYCITVYSYIEEVTIRSQFRHALSSHWLLVVNLLKHCLEHYLEQYFVPRNCSHTNFFVLVLYIFLKFLYLSSSLLSYMDEVRPVKTSACIVSCPELSPSLSLPKKFRRVMFISSLSHSTRVSKLRLSLKEKGLV